MTTSTTQRGSARTAILNAAQKLFAERGYDGTSTTAIAKTAGVATGLVFYHFSTKAQLLDSLLEERTFEPELERLLETANEQDPHLTLTSVGVRFLEVLEHRSELTRILLQDVAVEQAQHGRLETIIARAMDALASHLQTGQRAFSPQQAETLARTFLSTLLVAGLMVPPKTSTGRFVDQVVDLLLNVSGDTAADAPHVQ